jgi:predicted CoA-binding protein
VIVKTIPEILERAKTVAVVGWSEKPERPSHWIAAYLEKVGYQVTRVNPGLANRGVAGVVAAIPQGVDVVDVFRSPEHVPAVVAEAIAAGAKVVWMQPGAENEEAAATARAAGLTALVGPCMYAEHRQRFGDAEGIVRPAARSDP